MNSIGGAGELKLVLGTNLKKTNTILIKEEKFTKIFYLPIYLRIILNGLDGISPADQSGSLNITILLSIYLGNLPESILQQFIDNSSYPLTLKINGKDSIRLLSSQGIPPVRDREKQTINFEIQQSFGCSLDSSVFFSPFELYTLILSAELKKVILNDGKIIAFNCMDNSNYEIVRFPEILRSGYYRLAPYFTDYQFSNQKESSFKQISLWKEFSGSIEESKPENTYPAESQANAGFNFAHFRFSFYKFPFKSLVLLFTPIFVVGAISLVIFFQSVDLGARVASIAVVLLVYVALLPTVNSSIPAYPYILYIQYLIAIQSIATLLVLIQSLYLSLNPSTDYVFLPGTDGFFISAVILNLFTLCSPIVLYIFHLAFWVPIYLKENKLHRPGIQKGNFKLKDWSNEACDELYGSKDEIKLF